MYAFFGKANTLALIAAKLRRLKLEHLQYRLALGHPPLFGSFVAILFISCALPHAHKIVYDETITVECFREEALTLTTTIRSSSISTVSLAIPSNLSTYVYGKLAPVLVSVCSSMLGSSTVSAVTSVTLSRSPSYLCAAGNSSSCFSGECSRDRLNVDDSRRIKARAFEGEDGDSDEGDVGDVELDAVAGTMSPVCRSVGVPPPAYLRRASVRTWVGRAAMYRLGRHAPA